MMRGRSHIRYNFHYELDLIGNFEGAAIWSKKDRKKEHSVMRPISSRVQ